jgi:quercetin dioxygenase-like cupin family protein
MPIALPTRDLGGLAEWYAAHPADWPVRPEFDPRRRWYARLSRPSTGHEAWLLTWLPGQSTDLHDHGGAAGAFTVIEGQLTEQVPTRAPAVRLVDRGYGVGATRGFGPHHVHRMVNTGALPAVTLHVYAPVLTRMTRYVVRDGALLATGVEREGRDW